MLGTETTYVSSPIDLIESMNARSLLCGLLSRRQSVGAVLATVTKVYSHSKAICDRLNNSSLENITINLNGYEIILVERANGLTEYAVNSLYSSYSQQTCSIAIGIEQYPADYLNFQVWGSSTAQFVILQRNYF
jgi:hypothetical protein